MFESSNASSILGTVEHESYGVISAFLNLVRNGSIAIAITLSVAIVTAIMNSQGYALNPGSVESDEATKLLTALHIAAAQGIPGYGIWDIGRHLVADILRSRSQRIPPHPPLTRED